MLLLIGLTLVVMVVLFTYDSFKRGRVVEFGSRVFATFIVSIVAGMAGMLLVSLPAVEFFSKDVTLEYNLKAMNDGSETNGSFFLGSGSIGEDPAFMFYIEYEDGSVALMDEYASDAIVVETTGQPKVTYDCEYVGHLPDILVWPVDHFGTSAEYECLGQVTFYVPEGSVRSDFTLDAE